MTVRVGRKVGLSSHLSLDTRRVGDAAVIAVRGDIDLTTSAEAEAALDAARPGATLLMLDLRAVGFMLFADAPDGSADGGGA